MAAPSTARRWKRLIKSGACDCFRRNARDDVRANRPRAGARGEHSIRTSKSGQNSLFGTLEEKAAADARSHQPICPNGRSTNCSRTKRNCSAFTSPAIRSRLSRRFWKNTRCTTPASSAELPNRSLTRIGGMVAAVQNGISKKTGKPYSMVTLEDLEGSVQIARA